MIATLELTEVRMPEEEEVLEQAHYSTRDLVLMLHAGARADRRRMEQIESDVRDLKESHSSAYDAIGLRLRTLEREDDKRSGIFQAGKAAITIIAAAAGAIGGWAAGGGRP